MSEKKQKIDGKPKLLVMMNKYINRLMVGALEVVETEYGTEGEEYTNARNKILRLGNNQKRDIKDFLDNYDVIITKYVMEMEFKPNNRNNNNNNNSVDTEQERD